MRTPHLTQRRARTDRVARRGFTLIEIIVVVTIIAILATMIAPRVWTNVMKANNSKARSEVQSIASVVTNYMLDMQYSSLPDDFDLEVLVLPPDDGGGPSGPYLQKRENLLDPWGRDYVIIIPGEINYDFDVVSLGEDGELNTEDDVTN
jgi:general secretion pathway protein G